MRRGRFAKNAGLLMVMELGVRGMDVLVSVLVVRYLAPEGFGLLIFAVAFAGLFSILPGFGMGSLSVRNVARDPGQLNRFLTNGLIVKVMLAGVTLLVIWAASMLFGQSPERRWLVMLAASLMILETNVTFVLSFFQAVERMKTTVAVNLGVRGGWVISSLAVMFLGGGIADLLGARIVVTALGLLVAFAMVHFRLRRVSWQFDPAFAWHILRSSVPFALFRVWMQLYADTDMVMLSMLRGDVFTSMYAAAQKTLRIFMFIPAAFSGANLPEMSRSSAHSRADLTRMIARRCKYLMILSLGMAGAATVGADWITALLYGPAYERAASVLRVGVWSLVYTFANSTLIAAIAAINRERQGSNQLFVGLLISVLSNFVVIPLFGPVGAAATTVMSRALIFSMELRLLRTVLPDLKLLHVGRLMGATALMMVLGWLSRPAGPVVTAIVCAAVYLGVLVATRTIRREEWASVMKLFQRDTRQEINDGLNSS